MKNTITKSVSEWQEIAWMCSRYCTHHADCQDVHDKITEALNVNASLGRDARWRMPLILNENELAAVEAAQAAYDEWRKVPSRL